VTSSFPASLAFPNDYDLRPLGKPMPVTERVSRWSTDQGDVAVKRFTAADSLRGAREAELIAFLGSHRDDAYRVQSLIRTTTGKTSTEHDGQRILVTRWEAGTYRPYDTYSAAEWACLGRCLASLHARLDEVTTPSPDTLSLRLGRIDVEAELFRLEPSGLFIPEHVGIDSSSVTRYLAVCRDMFASCYARAIEAFPFDDPEQPVHNDFNQFNYLFHSGLPPLIIDWEASIGAPREFEVVRCLNHLPLKNAALARSFLAGYLSLRPLHAERMRWAVDVSCVMHATKHWVLEGWIAGRAGFEERLRGAMEMVSMLARERNGLADFYIQCVGDAS